MEHRKGKALNGLNLRNPVSIDGSLGPPAVAQPELYVDPGKGTGWPGLHAQNCHILETLFKEWLSCTRFILERPEDP